LVLKELTLSVPVEITWSETVGKKYLFCLLLLATRIRSQSA